VTPTFAPATSWADGQHPCAEGDDLAAPPPPHPAARSAGHTGAAGTADPRVRPMTRLTTDTAHNGSAAQPVASPPTDGLTSVDAAPNSPDPGSDEDRRIAELDEYLLNRAVTTAETRALATVFGLSIVCTRSRIQNAISLRNRRATRSAGRSPLPALPARHDPGTAADTASDGDLDGYPMLGRSREDTVPVLKHQYNWSEVYARSRLPRSGCSPGYPGRLPSRVAVNREPDTLVIAVLLGLADIV